MTLLNRLKILKNELIEFFQISYEPTVDEIIIANKIKKINSNSNYFNYNTNTLLIPLLEDTAIMNLTLDYVNLFISQKQYSIKYFFVPTSIDQPVQKDKMFAFLFFYKKKHQQFKRLLKTYNLKNKDVIFSNYFLFFSKKNVTPFISKKEVLTLNRDKIDYGDLVYDTYLRFRAKPTINIEDKCLYDIIDYTKKLILKAEHFFSKQNKITILIPYTSYIHWGIISRVAIKYKHQVFSYGSTFYILSKIEREYPYHSKNYLKYKNLFKTVKLKKDKLNYAKN